jgi:hypothetical protein
VYEPIILGRLALTAQEVDGIGRFSIAESGEGGDYVYFSRYEAIKLRDALTRVIDA